MRIQEASAADIPLARELFLEYASSLDFDLGFQGFQEELHSLPGDYSPPQGAILLAFAGDRPAGCIALRPLEAGLCEMKRLYVRPGFQGRGLGRRLTEALLHRATELGYEGVRLDTVPSMKAAITMYRSMGFYEIPPYRVNPVAGATYFERQLIARPRVCQFRF